MKYIKYFFSIMGFLIMFSCKENGNDGNDNARGGKRFENAISNDSPGREQTIDGEELKLDTTNVKTGEKHH